MARFSPSRSTSGIHPSTIQRKNPAAPGRAIAAGFYGQWRVKSAHDKKTILCEPGCGLGHAHGVPHRGLGRYHVGSGFRSEVPPCAPRLEQPWIGGPLSSRLTDEVFLHGVSIRVGAAKSTPMSARALDRKCRRAQRRGHSLSDLYARRRRDDCEHGCHPAISERYRRPVARLTG